MEETAAKAEFRFLQPSPGRLGAVGDKYGIPRLVNRKDQLSALQYGWCQGDQWSNLLPESHVRIFQQDNGKGRRHTRGILQRFLAAGGSACRLHCHSVS